MNSEDLQDCPVCDNSYLAIRTDTYKDKRRVVYCDCCGLMSPEKVWNWIKNPAKQLETDCVMNTPTVPRLLLAVGLLRAFGMAHDVTDWLEELAMKEIEDKCKNV
jgi:hypothetical protein